MLQPFEKWVIDFVGHIQPQGRMGTRYIITATKYLSRWVETQSVKDYTGATTTKFVFEYVLTRFRCPNIFMSDRDMNFLNETINALMEEFQVYHQKSMPYHPQANGMVEEFNKELENMLTKIFNDQQNDLDQHIPALLWAYRMTCKKLTGKAPFRLFYGVEVVIPMEYIMPSMRIVALTGMTNHEALEERFMQLVELEVEIFLV